MGQKNYFKLSKRHSKDGRDHYFYFTVEFSKTDNNILSDNLGLITGNDEDNRIGEYPETKKEILDRFSPLSKNRKDIFGTVKEINLGSIISVVGKTTVEIMEPF